MDCQDQTTDYVEIVDIDEDTSRTLELVRNNDDVTNKKHTLFGILSTCLLTTSGANLLRENILRPFCRLSTINQRLDCVEFLVKKLDVLGCISSCLRPFGSNVDLESFIPALINVHKSRSSTIQIAEKRLDVITNVEHIVSQVPSLIHTLEGLNQSTLALFKESLLDPAYNEILDEIYSAIEPEVTVNKGKGKRNKMFRIKQGVDALFDVARCTYMAAIDDLEQYVRELNSFDNLPWKLSYAETKGYFLTLTNMPRNTSLDPKYIRVNRTRTQITCTTADLMRTNVRATISYENSMKLTNDILTNLISSIISHTESLYTLVNVISMLDVIANFAKLANNSNGSLIRPNFSPTETIILGSRHPVLESVLSVNDLSVEPNDVFFSVGSRNVMLVTGPNMGGKSIFLKQVALIQIMAQIGCYVPASSADIKLVNRIVARSGISTDHESSCSSFMWEMKGISSAVHDNELQENPSVLYVIDEVGRGTTIDDGTSYSFAIAEELASRKNCFTVFATHFEQVFHLAKLYNNIHAYHFKYEEETSLEGGNVKLKITHSLAPGIADKSHYGLRLAESFGLPEELLQIARKHMMLEKTPARTIGSFDEY